MYRSTTSWFKSCGFDHHKNYHVSFLHFMCPFLFLFLWVWVCVAMCVVGCVLGWGCVCGRCVCVFVCFCLFVWFWFSFVFWPISLSKSFHVKQSFLCSAMIRCACLQTINDARYEERERNIDVLFFFFQSENWTVSNVLESKHLMHSFL